MRGFAWVGILIFLFGVAGCGNASSPDVMQVVDEDIPDVTGDSGESGEPAASQEGPQPANGAQKDDASKEALPGAEETTRKRPESVDLQVTVEQVKVTMPFKLVSSESLPFSTYLFEEFDAEIRTEPTPGIRAVNNDENATMSLEVTLYPTGSSEEEVLAAFGEAVRGQGGMVDEHVPRRSWAVDSAIVDLGDHAQVYFLIQHDGQYVLMVQSFQWAEADAFAPVIEGFVGQWQWSDGTFLE